MKQLRIVTLVTGEHFSVTEEKRWDDRKRENVYVYGSSRVMLEPWGVQIVSGTTDVAYPWHVVNSVRNKP